MKNITLLLTAILTLQLLTVNASIGVGEWEKDICDNFVLSNSDIYESKPVLLIRKDKQEEIILKNVLRLQCLGNYVIGEFNINDSSQKKYFIVNRQTKIKEEFLNIITLNNRIDTLSLIPFYGRPFFNKEQDPFKQLGMFKFIEYFLVLIAFISLFITLKIIKYKWVTK